MSFHLTIEAAREALTNEAGKPFAVLLQHGSMQVEYFAPVGTDTQQPHRRDELYVIAAGIAVLFRNGERVGCKAGDVLFVPAGMVHRSENFSDDFATWVIFYGKEGGETNNGHTTAE